MKSSIGGERQIRAHAAAAEEGEEGRRNRPRVTGMPKETQRQDRVPRPSFVPDKDGEQNDSCADERGLHETDFSFAEIDERPHQSAAACAGEERAGKVEAAGALPDALV